MGEPKEDDVSDKVIGGTTTASVEEFETSLYDSLLRRVAAESSGTRGEEAAGIANLRVNAEVGLEGKFILQQEIGSGAMGRVYRARDRYLLRDVAIKFILRPEGMNHDDFMALFWQEAHIIARLDQHDNIVRILDVDRSGYPPFIVMEHLDGESLEKILQRGPIDVRMALHTMIAVARGLGEAHAQGVCHRDLKPSNIFVQKTGRVKLLDFGLARIRNHLFEVSTTKAGAVALHSVPPLASAGTPAYMAPEQWRGEDADAVTDLWAMGAILYRLLGNVSPFDTDSLAELSARVLSGEPPPPLAALCPAVPAEVCRLVERLLRFERAERPANVSEVIAVLKAALHQLATHAPSSGGDHHHVAQTRTLEAARSWGKMVLVVVSGPDAGARLLPDQLPEWILHRAGVHCEVLHCPPTQPGDVGDSAIRLRAYLHARINRPRHIWFITHGEGTKVVLRMLLDEARRLWPPGGGKLEFDVRSPFYRARHVAILRPERGVASAHHVAGQHAGLDTAPLAAELVAEARKFLEMSLPAPTIHDFYVGIDDRGLLHAGSPLVKSLADLLVRPEVMLARETIAQTFELDCAAKITSLIAPTAGAEADDVYPTVPGADAASQAEVFDDLLELARSQHQRPLSIVIAGDAGVGKSTVLRRVARHLCGEFVSDSGAVLPVLIPLYLASLTAHQIAAIDAASEATRGRVCFDVLLDWWCTWFNDVTYDKAISTNWIWARLRSKPVVLILDGLDEFITNHPSLSVSDFQQIAAFLSSEYRPNGCLTIVFGVRSTQPGLHRLAASNLREVLRLTTAQAMHQFPVASSWLAANGDAPTRKLLFTPLILAQLNTRRSSSTLRPSTNGEVIRIALTTIIEQSGLCGKLDERGQPIDAQRWIDALMAVAWCLFCRLRGEIAPRTLRADAAELYASWKDHLEGSDQTTQGERLLAGFHLLSESRACDLLLHRTILYPTGCGDVRFIHREWQDFLAASYLAQAVVYRHVAGFCHVGNTARISRVAGELVCQAGVCIDESLVVALLRHAQDTGARLITANFAALLTNSRVLIDGPAIDAFLSAISAMPAIARCITLSGLGSRALRGDDASAQDLRHRLVRVFRDYVSNPVIGDDLGVMRSLAWCFRKAYAQRFGGPPVDDPWPGLDDAAERGVLAMMCSISEDGLRFLAEHRSVQVALLDVPKAVADDPFHSISGVHYLYCLAVARRHGGGIAELGRELPALLTRGSPYAQMIERYQLVPELREVLAVCQRLELAP